MNLVVEYYVGSLLVSSLMTIFFKLWFLNTDHQTFLEAAMKSTRAKSISFLNIMMDAGRFKKYWLKRKLPNWLLSWRRVLDSLRVLFVIARPISSAISSAGVRSSTYLLAFAPKRKGCIIS